TYAKPAEKPKKMNIEDIWIFSRLNTLIDNCTNNFRSFNAHKAALDIKEFILNDFSRWYIKIIRDRVWPTYGGEDKNSAFYTLYEVSKNISLLLAPIAPHTAEYIHQNVLKPLGSKEESIHLCNWPKPNKKMINKELEEKMKKVRSIVETANAMRHEKKIKIRWPLKKITIYSDSDISEFENIIKFMCNVKNVEFKKSEKIEIDLDTEITEELKQEAMLREVIRKIQDMRKKNSMVISDKIILSLENCVELKKFENEIKNEVGAKEIRFEKNYGEILEFEDKKIRISIEKV
ncbi:MAG: class I tRNA ligase family protein, partial [Candidatus Aenigmatarchaeota archaeon]